MTTLRDYEVRARALLDLTAPMITRARESTRETEGRAKFLDLVGRVEAIGRCFAVGGLIEVGDHGAVLDAYFRRCHEISIKSKSTPVRPADVQAKVDELQRDHGRGLGAMEFAMARLRGDPLPDEGECEDPAAPFGCSVGPRVASVHDKPPPTCRYTGRAGRCALGAEAKVPAAIGASAALSLIPVEMRTSEELRVPAKRRVSSVDRDAINRRERDADRAIDETLRRQAGDLRV